jgi:ornithine carbamoyltransferase
MKGKNLVSMGDFSREEVERVIERARALKAEWKAGGNPPLLAGKTMAMIFEKPSLRTRVTFEAGMTQLGGHAIYLGQDIGFGTRETIADVAANLSRWVEVIIARTYAHESVVELAEEASVPVINALSDHEHPCQALAALLTLHEHKGNVQGLKLAWLGDGNNVCHSLLLICATMGINMTAACPRGYWPDPGVVEWASKLAQESGSEIVVTTDPAVAARGADALYTDVWASMGQESEAEERSTIFPPYQVNQALVDLAKEDVLVMHCLPAHRGEEITAEVLDGPHSVAVDEAENRLHVQKALMVEMLGL